MNQAKDHAMKNQTNRKRTAKAPKAQDAPSILRSEASELRRSWKRGDRSATFDLHDVAALLERIAWKLDGGD